jgi:hypothetical protein
MVRKMQILVSKILLCIARRPIFSMRFLDWERFWSTSSTYSQYSAELIETYSTAGTINHFPLRPQVCDHSSRDLLSLNTRIHISCKSTYLECYSPSLFKRFGAFFEAICRIRESLQVIKELDRVTYLFLVSGAQLRIK